MRHSKGFLVVLVAALAIVTLPAFIQRQDLATQIDEAVTLGPAFRANTAATGSSVDIANYAGVAVVGVAGHMDDAVLTSWVVLQDSSPGVWAATGDSVLADSVDNKIYELPYRGADRYLRVILRASGNAADSTNIGVIIVRSGARVR